MTHVSHYERYKRMIERSHPMKNAAEFIGEALLLLAFLSAIYVAVVWIGVLLERGP